MNDIYALREALHEAQKMKVQLVSQARKATRALQDKKKWWASAKTNALGETLEKTVGGRKLEIEAAMVEKDAELEVAELELKLSMVEIDCWKTQVSALQSEVKTHEIEARFA